MKKIYCFLLICSLLALTLTRQTFGKCYASGENTGVAADLQQASITDRYRQGLFDRFIRYVGMNSQSAENPTTDFPMTNEQIETAKALYDEIRQYGFPTILSDYYYIYVNIPSNITKKIPVLGFSAHYDTTPEVDGRDIKAQIHREYRGDEIIIREAQQNADTPLRPKISISPETDPYLNDCIGETIITSDGNTMLSGDDKAGVAILVTLIQTLAENPSIERGPIQIVITPNEEIGLSANKLELSHYHPDIAYDFDGENCDEVIVENFSADLYRITVQGVAGHPSHAKENGMLDAYQHGSKLIASIPDKYWPQESENKEPYFHVYQTEKQGSNLIISARSRYFSQEDGQTIDRMIRHKADSIRTVINSARNEALKDTIDFIFEVIKQYENVKYGVHPKAADIVEAAVNKAGLTPRPIAARSGTTIALIMARHGFAGYTIFTGQQRPHAYNEFLCERDMFDAYRVGLNLIKQTILEFTQ